MSKLNEKAMLDQINKHTYDNRLVPSTVCAYRENYNTYLVLLKIVNDTKMAMDTQEGTALIAIDLLVAFDTMNHQILLNILDKFQEIKGEAWQWSESYLENRSIRDQINNSLEQFRSTFLSSTRKLFQPHLFNLNIGTWKLSWIFKRKLRH